MFLLFFLLNAHGKCLSLGGMLTFGGVGGGGGVR